MFRAKNQYFLVSMSWDMWISENLVIFLYYMAQPQTTIPHLFKVRLFFCTLVNGRFTPVIFLPGIKAGMCISSLKKSCSFLEFNSFKFLLVLLRSFLSFLMVSSMIWYFDIVSNHILSFRSFYYSLLSFF